MQSRSFVPVALRAVVARITVNVSVLFTLVAGALNAPELIMFLIP